jgi:hypothetical protein
MGPRRRRVHARGRARSRAVPAAPPRDRRRPGIFTAGRLGDLRISEPVVPPGLGTAPGRRRPPRRRGRGGGGPASGDRRRRRGHPFGGGSNISGSLEPPEADPRTILSVDLGRMDRVLAIDETARLARVHHLRAQAVGRAGPAGGVRRRQVGDPAEVRGLGRHAVAPPRGGHRARSVAGAGHPGTRRRDAARAVRRGGSGWQPQPREGHLTPRRLRLASRGGEADHKVSEPGRSFTTGHLRDAEGSGDTRAGASARA